MDQSVPAQHCIMPKACKKFRFVGSMITAFAIVLCTRLTKFDAP